MNKRILFIKICFFFFVVSFLTCYLVIAWFNRFSADDFYLRKVTSDLGILGTIRSYYLNWEGAYFSWFLVFSSSSISNRFNFNPFLFNLLILSSVVCSFYLMAEGIFKRI